MSDPVTHEIDLDVTFRRLGRRIEGFECGTDSAGDWNTYSICMDARELIARLRAAEARAEAAEAERDALRDTIDFVGAQCETLLSDYTGTRHETFIRALTVDIRALVARNAPKEKDDNG